MDPDCRAILQVLKSPTRLYEDPVKQERLATKLPSVAFPNGNRGIGPHDIAMLGVGSAHVTIGLEGRLSAPRPAPTRIRCPLGTRLSAMRGSTPC